MKAQQSGFTLIELVIVIVILGILAAVAIPKFVDLSVEASDASAAGVAGALSSAGATNYAKRITSNGASGTAITSGTATCASLSGLLVGGLPTDVDFVAPATTITCTNPAGAGGASTDCKLKHAKGTAAGTTYTTVTAICTG